MVLALTASPLWYVVDYVRANLGLGDVAEAFGLGLLTLLRVVVLIALASLIWVPIGVWIGLAPGLAPNACSRSRSSSPPSRPTCCFRWSSSSSCAAS